MRSLSSRAALLLLVLPGAAWGAPRPPRAPAPPQAQAADAHGYGIRVLPGRMILGKPGDAYTDNADRPPLLPRHFDVVVHGNQHNIGIQRLDGSWINYDAIQLADMIRKLSGWNGKDRIRLLSCHVGAGLQDIAQLLANELRVPVYAPDAYISLTPGAADFGLGHAPTLPLKLSDLRLIKPTIGGPSPR